MRGYDLLKQWDAMPEQQRRDSLSWFLGGLAMDEEGWRDSKERPNYLHAVFALNSFEDAMQHVRWQALVIAGLRAQLSDAQLKPFLTGSRAYGVPRPESDWDVVCLLGADQIAALEASFEVRWTGSGRAIAWIGPVNLIICVDRVDYFRWQDVTDDLVRRRPVSRDEAVSAFNEAGLTGKHYEEAVGDGR